MIMAQGMIKFLFIFTELQLFYTVTYILPNFFLFHNSY